MKPKYNDKRHFRETSLQKPTHKLRISMQRNKNLCTEMQDASEYFTLRDKNSVIFSEVKHKPHMYAKNKQNWLEHTNCTSEIRQLKVIPSSSKERLQNFKKRHFK
jgi:hypothetical protein